MVKSNNIYHQRGFTLIETLMALLIMGVTTASLLVLIGQNTRYAADGEERLIASIVADNMMIEALANPLPLIRGEEDQEISAGGRVWGVRTIISETSLDGLISITIEVRKQGSRTIRSTITTLKTERQR